MHIMEVFCSSNVVPQIQPHIFTCPKANSSRPNDRWGEWAS